MVKPNNGRGRARSLVLEGREALLKQRVAAAKEAIERGEKLNDFAKSIGRTYGGLHRYFENHGYREIVEAFNNNRCRNVLPLDETVRRLEIVVEEQKKGRGWSKRAGRRIGVSYQRVHEWISNIAPDGAIHALEDFRDEGITA